MISLNHGALQYVLSVFLQAFLHYENNERWEMAISSSIVVSRVPSTPRLERAMNATAVTFTPVTSTTSPSRSVRCQREIKFVCTRVDSGFAELTPSLRSSNMAPSKGHRAPSTPEPDEIALIAKTPEQTMLRSPDIPRAYSSRTNSTASPQGTPSRVANAPFRTSTIGRYPIRPSGTKSSPSTRRSSASFLLSRQPTPSPSFVTLSRRRCSQSHANYSQLDDNESVHNSKFPPPPPTPTPPPPTPPPPPSPTTIDWLLPGTRKNHYHQVNKSCRGVKGLWLKCVRKLGFKKNQERFWEEGDSDNGQSLHTQPLPCKTVLSSIHVYLIKLPNIPTYFVPACPYRLLSSLTQIY